MGKLWVIILPSYVKDAYFRVNAQSTCVVSMCLHA